MKPLQKQLHPLLLFTISLFVFACASSEDKHGVTEMYHGRPRPVRMLPRTVIGAQPSGPFPTHQPQGIILMDSGADYRDETSMTYMISLSDRFTNAKGFGDVPAHYFVDTEGHIYMGRDVMSPAEFYEGDSFTLRPAEVSTQEALVARLAKVKHPPLKLDGYIVVMVLGDYERRLVSQEQEQKLFQLLSNIVHEQNISLENIKALSDLYPETKNPGFYLKNYLKSYILEKNIPAPPGTHRFMLPPRPE